MQIARKFDPASRLGYGFPSPLKLTANGTITAYTSHLDAWFVPPALDTEKHKYAATLADLQLNYQTLGAGGSNSDNFRLYLIDQTQDILGTGTVSSSGTTVTGVGTAFLSFFTQGQLIRAGTNTFAITAIATNTSMTIEASPGSAWATLAFYKVPFISLLATLSIPANQQFLAPVDLRTQNNNVGPNIMGLPIMPGQGVRLDTAAIGTGYTTTPAQAKLSGTLQLYGITC